MSADMIVHLEITDPAAFDAYRKVAGPTLEGRPSRPSGASRFWRA
jgi:hypothetical protein